MNEMYKTFFAMKKPGKNISLIFLIFTLTITGLCAQDTEPREIYLEFSTWKYNDMSRSLVAKITAENDDGEFFVEGSLVKFFVVDGENELTIGEAFSGKDGLAVLNMPDEAVIFPKDEDGYIYFIARFEGDNTFLETEEELMIRDVVISITFEENEGERLVYFEGIILGTEEDWPLADDDLYFYVPRMFSDMKIAEGWFEEDGTGYIGFPTTIIGDSLGNILVISRLEDHYDYGNVEVSSEINWAIPKKLLTAEGPVRELWTPIAPLWMIITLIIMLSGVWGHYIYAIIQLIKIRRSKN
jgi:hypothetical protein